MRDAAAVEELPGTRRRPTVRVGTTQTPDGATLSFRVDGEGPLALVACNGIGLSTFFWRRLAAHFAASGEAGPRVSFVTWDYRGHGASPVPADPDELGVALCARDLWTVVDHLGLGRAVLLGHSMGAQVILEAFRQRPEAVLALIPALGASGQTVSSPLRLPALEPLARLAVEVGSRNAPLVQAVLRRLLRLPGAFEAIRALGLVHPDLCPREDFEPYLEHLAQLDLRGYFALARDLLSHDAADLLPRIDVPTLVIGAERDLFVPLERSRELAAAIPGAELLVLRGSSHAALIEQPELVALALEKFLVTRSLLPPSPRSA